MGARALCERYDLCMSGESLRAVVQHFGEDALKHITPYVQIYARVAPQVCKLASACM